MNEERLQEIKDSVDFQREMLLAHNLETLCVDEEQELIDEIERLKEQLNDEIDDELKQSEIMVKKQEEIKRLKEEYVMLQNASDEVEEEKDREIERLTLESTKWESKFYDEAKKVDKAIKYIYLHSTQRKWFADISDRLHNQEIQFKGRIEDLLDILKGVDKE